MSELETAIYAALSTVIDPEIRRPITDLGMVESIELADDGKVTVSVLLTVAGCPMQNTIQREIQTALAKVDGVTNVAVKLGAMNDEQRAALRKKLRPQEKEIPQPRFAHQGDPGGFRQRRGGKVLTDPKPGHCAG